MSANITLGKSISTVIKGFLKKDDAEYPFLYTNGKLDVFPPDSKSKASLQSSFFEEINKPFQKGKVIPQLFIEGVTSTGQKIIFETSEHYSNNNGLLTYDIDSIYCYDKTSTKYKPNNTDDKTSISKPEDIKSDTDKIVKRIHNWDIVTNEIDGMVISGESIDLFFNPGYAFQLNNTWNENGSLGALSISALPPTEYDCGSIEYDGITLDVRVKAVATQHTFSAEPFSSKSSMIINFSKPVSIAMVKEVRLSIEHVLSFLQKRQNIELNETEIFCTNCGYKRIFGSFVIQKNATIQETDNKKKKRLIDYTIIKDCFSNLVLLNLQNKLYHENIPKCTADWNVYGPDRIIFNFAAFDRISELYYSEMMRSQDFYDVRSLFFEISKELQIKFGGKKKKAAKEIGKRILGMESSLQDRFVKIIKEHIGCIDVFMELNYGKTWRTKIPSIGSRLNTIRNDIAHGHMDLHYDDNTILDFETLEILLYAIWLRKAGLCDYNIKIAIEQLFHLGVLIEDKNNE